MAYANGKYEANVCSEKPISYRVAYDVRICRISAIERRAPCTRSWDVKIGSRI